MTNVKIEFNMENWSGDHTTLTCDPETLKFSMSHMTGYEFWLEPVQGEHESYTIRGNRWDPDFSLGNVWKTLSGENAAMEYGCERWSYQKFIAAAKLLCNTI